MLSKYKYISINLCIYLLAVDKYHPFGRYRCRCVRDKLDMRAKTMHGTDSKPQKEVKENENAK
jgi:hypothetical protein